MAKKIIKVEKSERKTISKAKPPKKTISKSASKKSVKKISAVKVVSLGDDLLKESDFLKVSGWKKSQKGDYILYEGVYKTEYYGQIPGVVECYVVKSGNQVISENWIAYAKNLPNDVLDYSHQPCFPWNEEKQMFLVHYTRPPQSLQQCVVSTEIQIDKIYEEVS